jgi:restriction endonuclease Mrr
LDLNIIYVQQSGGWATKFKSYVSKIGSEIVLIDGIKIGRTHDRIRRGGGYNANYTVNRIDDDFFEAI